MPCEPEMLPAGHSHSDAASTSATRTKSTCRTRAARCIRARCRSRRQRRAAPCAMAGARRGRAHNSSSPSAAHLRPPAPSIACAQPITLQSWPTARRHRVLAHGRRRRGLAARRHRDAVCRDVALHHHPAALVALRHRRAGLARRPAAATCLRARGARVSEGTKPGRRPRGWVWKVSRRVSLVLARRSLRRGAGWG